MSPNINSFVGDLVEMARAMEELPDVKAKLMSANSFIDDLAKTVQERELRIIELKAEIDRQAHTITTLEVARDDAELRFLEADDRMGKIASAFQVALEAMDHTDKVIEQAKEALHPTPPMPEVVQAAPVDPKPEPAPSEFIGVQDNPTPVAMSGDPIDVDSWASGPGQSDTTPMEPSSMIDGEENTGQVSTPSEPSKGRYSGRRYYDWATYVPLHQWLAEGGTEEDYNWRPVSSRIG